MTDKEWEMVEWIRHEIEQAQGYWTRPIEIDGERYTVSKVEGTGVVAKRIYDKLTGGHNGTRMESETDVGSERTR